MTHTFDSDKTLHIVVSWLTHNSDAIWRTIKKYIVTFSSWIWIEQVQLRSLTFGLINLIIEG